MGKSKDFNCPHCGRIWIVKRDELGQTYFKFACGSTCEIQDFSYVKKYTFKCKIQPAADTMRQRLPYKDD